MVQATVSSTKPHTYQPCEALVEGVLGDGLRVSGGIININRGKEEKEEKEERRKEGFAVLGIIRGGAVSQVSF